ncbi:hypothetical protein [Natranaerobius thermophilus]|uniref:Uncharacterized protein n=1 Tax=Natranaerobius thermophilus (strain ATCC BAA-1301 / DSM 18059 / JW/NM-WN-LF) TaxID=457570 RepID=B2A2F3_NATTJ|nr:hypothetical protein [Natranaerobius thermophilus]ACB86259.1 hypothetical protein Nther_2705 [Natranaerobius thermophilus JW/NM-WN-LF]
MKTSLVRIAGTGILSLTILIGANFSNDIMAHDSEESPREDNEISTQNDNRFYLHGDHFSWEMKNGLQIDYSFPETETRISVEKETDNDELINERKFILNIFNPENNNKLGQMEFTERSFEKNHLQDSSVIFLDSEFREDVVLEKNTTVSGQNNSGSQFKTHEALNKLKEINGHVAFVGDIIHFESWENYRGLIDKEHPQWNRQRFTLSQGEGLNTFIIDAGKMELEELSGTCIEALKTSYNYHGHLEWQTAQGSYRQTPQSYYEDEDPEELPKNLHNLNLQVTTPLLIMDYTNFSSNPLFDVILLNSAHTIMGMMGEDGFFRTDVEANYLNRAFGITDGFIDTRMSADASIFLLDAGKEFQREDWVQAGTNYVDYFNKVLQKDLVYELDGGTLFPDYFHEDQHQNKIPVASLNHTIHNINYLFHLLHHQKTYNQTILSHEEYNQTVDLLKKMLNGLRVTSDDWLKDSGDLYYGYSESQGFYGDDYPFITYRDLKVLKSHLKSELPGEISSEGFKWAVTNLFESKHSYLQESDEYNYGKIYEDNLTGSHIKTLLGQEVTEQGSKPIPRYGRSLASIPVDIDWESEPEFYSLGRYLWITGANSIHVENSSSTGAKQNLSPKTVYKLLIHDDEITIKLDQPKTPAPGNTLLLPSYSPDQR